MSEQREPHPQEKGAFFKTFSLVVVALHILAGVLIVIALTIHRSREPDPQDQQLKRQQLAERIAPVTRVVTSEAELTKVKAEQAAQGGGNAMAALNGEQVVAQVCGACHNTGVLNAPKSHDAAAWQPRLQAAGGVDGLVASAIKGKGQMPPKGGAPDLSDDQLRQAIEVMIR